MSDMATVYSSEWHEDIAYYPDDLYYSYTVMGVGYKSGKPYNLTFDDDGNLIEADLMWKEIAP